MRSLPVDGSIVRAGASQFQTWSPDYILRNPRFLFPGFWSTPDGDQFIRGGSVTIRSVLIYTSWLKDPRWIEVPGASFSGMAALDGSRSAWLSPAIGVEIPANTHVIGRVYYAFSGEALEVPSGALAANVAGNPKSFERAAGIFQDQDSAEGPAWHDRASGAPENPLPRLANGRGPFLAPIMMIGQGARNTVAYLGLGPSGTMYGSDDDLAPRNWSNRGAFGAIDRALDDNSTVEPVSGRPTKRFAICNFGVPGAYFLNKRGNFESLVNVSPYNDGKWAALDLVKAETGDWPFDKVIVEPLLNSIPRDFETGKRSLAQLLTELKARWGRPIVYNEGNNGGAFNSDGRFVLLPAFRSPDGMVPRLRTLVSDKGVPSKNAWLRKQGLIEDSFTQWTGSASSNGGAEFGTPQPPSSYRAQLSSGVEQGARTLSLTAPPQAGMVLQYRSSLLDGRFARVIVLGVENGIATIGSGALPAAAGAPIIEAFSKDGSHPSPRAHALLQVRDILAYKARVSTR
ncbi:hypothetical protein [Sphingomonas sp.]|uniref:hypothetical protein n=1 Tax=Sphingomonas sp. TaxID=28214 RepID=UPI002DE74358|nr:hypothetical protein [Sphingomonas sp.]